MPLFHAAGHFGQDLPHGSSVRGLAVPEYRLVLESSGFRNDKLFNPSRKRLFTEADLFV
jgi:hypothetical protein